MIKPHTQRAHEDRGDSSDNGSRRYNLCHNTDRPVEGDPDVYEKEHG